MAKKSSKDYFGLDRIVSLVLAIIPFTAWILGVLTRAKEGKWIAVIIRIFGGYPEGVSYSILLMNLCVPLIDRYTRPKIFGALKKEAKKA